MIDMSWGQLLGSVARGESLSRARAAQAMGAIMDGEATPAQIAGFLMALRSKGETVDEITGCAEAIRRRAMPVPHHYPALVDTCGTGGDGSGTFNISTTAAFIVAGAGQKVAKHGNRAISSQTGSADVLDAMGVQVDLAGPEASGALDEVGMTFLFAPTFHSAMRHAGPVRRELGTRTVFNLLGPLCNPAGATHQLVGVFDGDLVPVIAQVLANLDARRAIVVHGSDGLDELTITGPSRVAEWNGRDVREYVIDPDELGIPRGSLEELAGGDAQVNARIFRQVLEGADGGALNIALLNAAAALVAAEAAGDLREGLALARESVRSGAALARLDALIEYSRRLREREGGRPVQREQVAALSTGWGKR